MGKAVDTVITLDEHAIGQLQRIEKYGASRLSLPYSVVQMLNPLSAFHPREQALAEQEAKKILRKAYEGVARRFQPCIEQATELRGLLRKIQATLSHIGRLTGEEMGRSPQTGILTSL